LWKKYCGKSGQVKKKSKKMWKKDKFFCKVEKNLSFQTVDKVQQLLGFSTFRTVFLI